MAPLTNDRNTPRFEGDIRQGPVATAAMIYAGAIVMRNAAGYLVQGQTATGLVAVGRAEERVDNSAGANGDLNADYRPGCYRFANSSGDPITLADVGNMSFVEDDQTVARTDGTATRSPAGIIDGLDAQGVWVRFDEALTNAS